MLIPFPVILLVFAAVLGVLISDSLSANELSISAINQKFLNQYWQTPIQWQGKAPNDYTAQESSLLPEDCGLCHVQQNQDWQNSLHAKAMGPGVLGQTIVMQKNDPATAQLCWSCHAPMSEQQPILLRTTNKDQQNWVNNPNYNPALQKHGITCAACHVRNHKRFGPPRKNSPDQTGLIDEGLPHGGFIAKPAFSSSEFCKVCHQFKPDGYALNGKLIENTYQEWLESGYPERGVECQSCHMPDRRHLWRGIHDPQMTRKGVTITASLTDPQTPKSGVTSAEVTIANTSTGHHFPTYLTPRIVVSGQQIDESGNTIESSIQQMVIGREVTLNLSEEIFDTRIPSGEKAIFNYRRPLAKNAQHLLIQIRVEPNYFYEKFYRTMLEKNLAGEGEELIRKAWENSRSSPYILFEKKLKLR